MVLVLVPLVHLQCSVVQPYLPLIQLLIPLVHPCRPVPQSLFLAFQFTFPLCYLSFALFDSSPSLLQLLFDPLRLSFRLLSIDLLLHLLSWWHHQNSLLLSFAWHSSVVSFLVVSLGVLEGEAGRAFVSAGAFAEMGGDGAEHEDPDSENGEDACRSRKRLE